MRKRKQPVSRKCILSASMAVSLCAVGISYAAWSDKLQVAGNMTTGVLNMAFSQDIQTYTADIVDSADNTVETIAGVEVQLSNEGKVVELAFTNGLPLADLLEGDLLKVSFPLENEEGTFTSIREYDLNLTVPWKTVEMEPQAQSLVLNGQEYTVDESTVEFAIPLQFEVFQSFSREPDLLMGSLYFRLTDDSCESIQNLPQTLEVPAAVLEESRINTAVTNPEIAVVPSQDGVLVEYTCMVPVGLDQNHVAYGIIRAGEG